MPKSRPNLPNMEICSLNTSFYRQQLIYFVHAFIPRKKKNSLNRLRTNDQFSLIFENSVSKSLPIKTESHTINISDILSYLLNILIYNSLFYNMLYITYEI